MSLAHTSAADETRDVLKSCQVIALGAYLWAWVVANCQLNKISLLKVGFIDLCDCCLFLQMTDSYLFRELFHERNVMRKSNSMEIPFLCQVANNIDIAGNFHIYHNKATVACAKFYSIINRMWKTAKWYIHLISISCAKTKTRFEISSRFPIICIIVAYLPCVNFICIIKESCFLQKFIDIF